VTSDSNGIIINKIVSGKTLSSNCISAPLASRNRPENVIFIADPVLLIKYKNVPLRNNSDSIVVSSKYKD
jgi:hypothetical protein